jgi:hypothetical protein
MGELLAAVSCPACCLYVSAQSVLVLLGRPSHTRHDRVEPAARYIHQDAYEWHQHLLGLHHAEGKYVGWCHAPLYRGVKKGRMCVHTCRPYCMWGCDRDGGKPSDVEAYVVGPRV